VVKIKTRRGADAGLHVEGSLGSDHFRSGSISYGNAVGDFDFLAGIQSYRDGGFRENSLSYANMLNGSVGWFLSDTDTLTLRASGGESYMQFPGPLTYQQMMDDPSQSRNLGDEYSEEWTVRSTLLYETERDWGAARINFGANYCNRTPSISGLYAENDLAGYSVEPRVRYGTEENYLMAGVDLFYNQLNQDNFLDKAHQVQPSWADISRFTGAPYCFAQRTMHEKIILNGGARWEYARTDNEYVEYVRKQLLPTIGPFPNPDYKNPPDVDPNKSYSGIVSKNGWAAEASVSFPITHSLETWFGYDRVYRYPTLDETAAYQGYPLSDPLNKNLDPEEGDNLEWGIRWMQGAWQASATLFCLWMDNEIVYDDVQKLNRNMGATQRRGSELELGWQQELFGLSTRWTLVDARLDGGENDGCRVPLVPKAHGTLSTWIQPFQPLRLAAVATYLSDQYQGNDEKNKFRKMKAYALLGLTAQLTISEGVIIDFSVDNLFNKTYASSAYSGGYYPGAGRSFHAGIRLSY
jgi:iron complex outermembrane receptor protein